jgi:tripartite-type tricarboxylate transporter receptor subunit TctC
MFCWLLNRIRFRRVTGPTQILIGLLAVGGLFGPISSEAAWPERPIRFIVPVAAGGGVDLMARILVDRLNQQLPQRVVIENIGGGGGAIGARDVAKSDPDGYTFLFAAPGFAAVPATHQPSPYDPIAEFRPVSLVTEFPLVAIVRPEIPANTIPEFIALLKKNPDKYNYGSSGVGGSSHMPVELFKYLAGVQMTHVPFRGNSESSAALLGGQIDFIIDGLGPQLGNIADKRVRVLGVTTQSRTPFLPDVPAINEFLPGYEYPMWVAIFAPEKTPPGIIAQLSAEVAKATRDPATRKRYEDVEATPVGSTPVELDEYFRRQLKFNADIAQRANIRLSD